MNIRGSVAFWALMSSLDLWSTKAAAMFTETFDGGLTPFTACDSIYLNGITYTYTGGTGVPANDCRFCNGCGPNDLMNILEGDAAGTLRLEFDCPQDISTFEIRENVPTGTLSEVVNVKTFLCCGTEVTNQNVLLEPVPGSFFDGALVGVMQNPSGSRIKSIEIDFSVGQSNRFAVDEFSFDSDPRECECTGMPVPNAPECAGFDPAEHVYVAGEDCTYFFQCYGGTNWGCNCCPDGLLFNEFGDSCDCQYPGDVVCRDPLEWEFTTSGIGPNGGWSESDGGLCVWLDIDDDINCGAPGGNPNVQTGTASVTFDVAYDYDLTAAITGLVELQNSGFEVLEVFIDGSLVISAESQNLLLGCAFGDPIVTDVQMQPYLLTAGSHTIYITFTSNDPLFHQNAFYMVCFDFGPALEPDNPACCTNGELLQATTDCAGYVTCVSHKLPSDPTMCMGGLKFNPDSLACDWPNNFVCDPADTCMPMGPGFDRRHLGAKTPTLLGAKATAFDHHIHKLRGGRL